MSDDCDRLLPISSARAAGERLGMRSVIVFQELPDGRWGYTSWGKTKADCGRARRIADGLFEDLGRHVVIAEAPASRRASAKRSRRLPD